MSAGETTLHLLRDSDTDPLLDLVFIHGLDGDYSDTWRSHDGKEVWPKWLGDEFPQARIHSLAYEAASSKWFAGGALPLPSRAKDALDELVLRAIGERPTIFICHSMGGLLLKAILRKASESPKELDRRLAASTRHILFIATPHHGSSIADYVNLISKFYRRP